MSVSWQLLALPLTEALVMGLLAGLVGALALLDRRIFLTESLTHSTFPGAVAGVVVASGAATALTGARASHEALSAALLIGAVLLCLPMARLMRWLSTVPGVSSPCAAGVVLAGGFSLGSLLSTWFAPLPLKVDSFLAGSLLNVGVTDVALATAVLAAALAVVAVGGRLLVFHCFDAVGYRAAGLRSGPAEAAILILICLTIGALVPAIGTILPIALIAAPAASIAPWVRGSRGLLVGAALAGAACCLVGTGLAVTLELSVGGVIATLCGGVYALSRLARLIRPGRRAGRSS